MKPSLRVLMDSGVFQHAARPPRDTEKDQWLLEELAFVPQVIEAVRRGAFSLCIAQETAMELWGAPRAALPHSPLNPFAGISLERVPPPYHYGRVVLSYDWKGDEWVKRRRAFLRDIQDPEYLRVLGLIGPTKLEDAFLVMTALRAGIHAVLTMDRKFYNGARSLRDKQFPVEVHTPSTLARLTSAAQSERRSGGEAERP